MASVNRANSLSQRFIGFLCKPRNFSLFLSSIPLSFIHSFTHSPTPFLLRVPLDPVGADPRHCILSPCLFNFYVEYIMRNAGLEETQAGIKIAGRNISNLRYASLVAQRLKRLPPVRETWVRFLGRKDPLEKEMAIHCTILAWRIPWTEEPGRLQFMGS